MCSVGWRDLDGDDEIAGLLAAGDRHDAAPGPADHLVGCGRRDCRGRRAGGAGVGLGGGCDTAQPDLGGAGGGGRPLAGGGGAGGCGALGLEAPGVGDVACEAQDRPRAAEGQGAGGGLRGVELGERAGLRGGQGIERGLDALCGSELALLRGGLALLRGGLALVEGLRDILGQAVQGSGLAAAWRARNDPRHAFAFTVRRKNSQNMYCLAGAEVTVRPERLGHASPRREARSQRGRLRLCSRHRCVLTGDGPPEAEAAYRSKASFMAAMSHELRTPLNIIIGFSTAMIDHPEMYDGAPISEAVAADIAEIKRSGQHLLSLINDILETASAT